MAKRASANTHPVPAWAFELFRDVIGEYGAPTRVGWAGASTKIEQLSITWTRQERKVARPTGRTVKSEKRPRARGFSYRPVYSSLVEHRMVEKTVRRWGQSFRVERREPVYNEWREIRVDAVQERSSSGFTMLGVMSRIHVREGSDRTDVAHVILHELAHWLTQSGHDAAMYRCFFRLVEKYGPKYGLTVEAARRRERSYKPRASEAGYRQHFGSAS